MPLWSADNWDSLPMVNIHNLLAIYYQFLFAHYLFFTNKQYIMCVHTFTQIHACTNTPPPPPPPPPPHTHTHTHTHAHTHTHTGAIAVTSGIFSDSSQSPTLSSVPCSGSETNLLRCSHSASIDSSICTLPDDAGVVCQGIVG